LFTSARTLPLLPPPPLTVHLFAHGMGANAAVAHEPLRALANRLRDSDFTVVFHAHDADPRPMTGPGPAVYVSIGGAAVDFPLLFAMPLAERSRWLHFAAPEAIEAGALLYCWLASTDPLPEAVDIPAADLGEAPLVSVFTAACRTGNRIQRPYRSLLAQSYVNWEWIIVDDSGDDGATFAEWIAPLSDDRLRKFRPAGRSGYIGTVKREAASRCRGAILVELDHDDELTPDALQRLVDAFRRHPECGFAFGEAAEIYEETLASHWYGWDAGFGYLVYWRQFDGVTGRIVDVPRTAGANWRTVRHLVGLPNHPRAWTRAAYQAVGGHRAGLSVADDYDLIVRSLLGTRLLRVPHLLYLQYRNAGGGNQTFVRNRQIQMLCAEVERYYRPRLEARLLHWGLPSLDGLPYRRLWTCSGDDLRWATAEVCDLDEAGKQSFLFVFPFGDGSADTRRLLEVLTSCQDRGWRQSEVVAVGRVPEGVLEVAARRAPPGRVRWWTTEAGWPVDDIARYGRLLCSGAVVEEGGADAGAQARPARLPLQYVDAFVPAATADLGCDRLSVLMELTRRHGYRRYLEIGTDRDEVFAQMNGFELKIGVDPHAGGTHRMTSDAYFAANRARPPQERDRFDLVLVDGLHEWEQVLRDVDNALDCLLPGGTIVLHDCMPFEERQQVVPRPLPMGFWTGDVWKAVFRLRSRVDVDVAVGRFDWGVGVVRQRPNSRPFTGPPGDPAHWTWAQFVALLDEGLNTMDYTTLMQWIDTPPPCGAPQAPAAGQKAIDMAAMRQERFFVATPCYGGMVTEPYLHSLLRLVTFAHRNGLTIDINTIVNESLVTRARNELVAAFMASEATHLVFIDADIAFDVEAFMRLYAAGKDVAVGAYPKKRLDWERIRRTAQLQPDGDAGRLSRAGADFAINFAGSARDEAPVQVTVIDGLIPLLDAGTGFMMIRRAVIERLMAAHPELHYASDDPDADPAREPHRWALFDTLLEPVTKRYLSEDYTFCRRWQALGGEIWLDPQIELTHVGSMKYQGLAAEHLHQP
jgi:glycosyltransferase involved in cell wall biosynthesis